MTNNLTILYVEDEETVRESFSEILEQYFSKVIVASDGNEALLLYDKYKPEIALLDISIPYVNGLKVASKIREVDRKIEIVILTAYSEKDKLLEAVNLQLFAYLLKPIQLYEFELMIKNLLNRFNEDEILYLINDFVWNINKAELFYKNKNIKLTNNERQVITLLCNNPNQYFSSSNLYFEISKSLEDGNKQYNTIIQLLSRFKNKTAKKFNIDNFFIENTYGLGYKIVIK